MRDFRDFVREANYDVQTRRKVPYRQRGDLLKRYAANPNAYVSFTALPKLGVNPQSTYDTPVGIYCYPVAYAETLWDAGTGRFLVPFAAEQPYAYVFEVKQPDRVLHFTSDVLYDRDDPDTHGSPRQEGLDLRPYYDQALILHEYIRRVEEAAHEHAQVRHQIPDPRTSPYVVDPDLDRERLRSQLPARAAYKKYSDLVERTRFAVRRLLGGFGTDSRDYLGDAMRRFGINTYYNDSVSNSWDPDAITRYIIEEYAQDQHRFARTYPLEDKLVQVAHLSPRLWQSFKRRILGPHQRIPCDNSFVWNATRWLADMNIYTPEAKATLLAVHGKKDPAPKVWTKLLLDLGLVGCHDHGTGTIHTNEPTQAVFFRVSDLNVLDRLDNARDTRYGTGLDPHNFGGDYDVEPPQPYQIATPDTDPETLANIVTSELGAAQSDAEVEYDDDIRTRLLNAYRALSILKVHRPGDFGRVRRDAYHAANDLIVLLKRLDAEPSRWRRRTDWRSALRVAEKILKTARSGVADTGHVPLDLTDLDGDL